MSRDPIDAFVRHVVETPRAAIPAAAREATRTFVLDTLGVAVAGSAGPWVRELIETQVLSLAGEHLVTSQLIFRVRQLLERCGLLEDSHSYHGQKRYGDSQASTQHAASSSLRTSQTSLLWATRTVSLIPNLPVLVIPSLLAKVEWISEVL